MDVVDGLYALAVTMLRPGISPPPNEAQPFQLQVGQYCFSRLETAMVTLSH